MNPDTHDLERRNKGNQSGVEDFGRVTKEESDFNDPGPAGGTTDPILDPQGASPGPSRAFERDYQYDAYGWVKRVVTRIDEGGSFRTYTEKTTYDEFGRVFQQFDASGDDRGIRYHYNERGYLSTLQEARYGSQGRRYWFAQDQDAWGNVTRATLDNQLVVRADYDPATGWLMNLWTDGTNLDTHHSKNGIGVENGPRRPMG